MRLHSGTLLLVAALASPSHQHQHGPEAVEPTLLRRPALFLSEFVHTARDYFETISTPEAAVEHPRAESHEPRRQLSSSSTCAAGWTPAPATASWGAGCYKSVPYATSLGQCGDLCAAEGGAPTCIESADELAFLTAKDGLTSGWPHYVGHYDGDKCASAPSGARLLTYAFPSGTGPIELKATGRNSWPHYAHSMLPGLWSGVDRYELLECMMVASRFVSQHYGVEHNATGPWHPVPCDLGGCTVEHGCVRCLSKSHDDWVPPNASCLCSAGKVASSEFEAFVATYDARQIAHWSAWQATFFYGVLSTWLQLVLVPFGFFLVALAAPRLWRLCRPLCPSTPQVAPPEAEKAPDPEQPPPLASATAAPAQPPPHTIGRVHRMGSSVGSLLKRKNSFAARSARLSQARAAAFTIRVRVSGFLFFTGWACATWAMNAFVNFGGWFKLTPPYSGHMPLNWIGWPVGISLMLLALFPIDAMAIRATCILVFVGVGGMGTFLFSFMIGDPDMFVQSACDSREVLVDGGRACRTTWLVVGAMLTLFFAALFSLAPTVICDCADQCCRGNAKRSKRRRHWAMTPRAALRRVWNVMRCFFCVIGLAAMGLGVMNSFSFEDGCTFCHEMATFGASWVFTALVATSKNRGRIHRWLIGLGTRGDQQQEAACIAALISGSSSSDVLSEGAKRFRALPLSSITAEDLSDNQDTSMFDRTSSARLGEVDAFISHSWHDAGGAKFAQLQHWGAKMRAANDGREPLVWLDKACIDQTSIAVNLASLPVFLSGCKSLVVLAGETYPRRLWCALELFTYLRMGGSRDQIVVYRVGGAKCLSALTKFDALKARCFFASERERLLAVVEAGYGDVRPFNKLVRSILDVKEVGAIIDAEDTEANAAMPLSGEPHRLE